MADSYLEMDEWSSEQVALFKEQVRTYRRTRRLEAVARSPETLVAEGDSWFDYLPGTDIIDCLRNYYDYDIVNYARAGDTLENMIYGTDITNRFERTSPTIDRVLRKLGELKPRAFLFSGGGNDVAGEEFESYLNHKNSGLPALRERVVNDMINVIFRKYYEDLIAKVAAVSPETHIIVHGYGYTAPTGKGVNFLFFTFSGPWLRPALAKKGIFDPDEQQKTVFTLLKAFNEMLADLAEKHGPKFRYVNLLEMINPDEDWVNELHLRNSAFARVAEQIHEEIESLEA